MKTVRGLRIVKVRAKANEEIKDIRASNERFGLLSIFLGSIRTLHQHYNDGKVPYRSAEWSCHSLRAFHLNLIKDSLVL